MPTAPTWAVLVCLTVLTAPRVAQEAIGRRIAERDERGMTTEAVIITALLAALAIAALAVITTKVMTRANSINL